MSPAGPRVIRGNDRPDPPPARPSVLRARETGSWETPGSRYRSDRPEPEPGPARSVGQLDPRETLALNPALSDWVSREIAEAYERGRQEGRSMAAGRVDQLGSAIAMASARVGEFTETERIAATNTVIELSERIATLVLGRTPHDGGEAVLARVRKVLEDHDDAPFTVEVNPDDLALLSAAITDDSVTVRPDPHLAPGEARVHGAWSHAELTRTAIWEAIRASLADQNEAQPLDE